MPVEVFLTLPGAGVYLRKKAVETILTAPPIKVDYHGQDVSGYTSFRALISDLFAWEKAEQGYDFWLALVIRYIPLDAGIDFEPRKVTMAEVCEKFGERVVIVEGEEAAK